MCGYVRCGYATSCYEIIRKECWLWGDVIYRPTTILPPPNTTIAAAITKCEWWSKKYYHDEKHKLQCRRPLFWLVAVYRNCLLNLYSGLAFSQIIILPLWGQTYTIISSCCVPATQEAVLFLLCSLYSARLTEAAKSRRPTLTARIRPCQEGGPTERERDVYTLCLSSLLTTTTTDGYVQDVI